MSDVVLDASALLAVLRRERGAEIVAGHIAEAVMSTVNLAEVLAVLVDKGLPEPEGFAAVQSLGLTLVDVDVDLARASAQLRETTRRAGLSLGGRTCLALAEHLRLPVLTADRAWATLDLSLDIHAIR